MVTQVFIVVVLYDGRQKPYCISQILMKKKGALLKDETFGRRQALIDTMTERRHLCSCGHLSDSCRNYFFEFLCWTVILIRQLPLYKWLNLCRPFISLLTDEGSPLTIVNFCAKGNGRRELDNNYSKKINNNKK